MSFPCPVRGWLVTALLPPRGGHLPARGAQLPPLWSTWAPCRGRGGGGCLLMARSVCAAFGGCCSARTSWFPCVLLPVLLGFVSLLCVERPCAQLLCCLRSSQFRALSFSAGTLIAAGVRPPPPPLSYTDGSAEYLATVGWVEGWGCYSAKGWERAAYLPSPTPDKQSIGERAPRADALQHLQQSDCIPIIRIRFMNLIQHEREGWLTPLGCWRSNPNNSAEHFGALNFRQNSFPVAWIVVLGPEHIFLLVAVWLESC